jgi:hypothetical protein
MGNRTFVGTTTYHILRFNYVCVAVLSFRQKTRAFPYDAKYTSRLYGLSTEAFASHLALNFAIPPLPPPPARRRHCICHLLQSPRQQARCFSSPSDKSSTRPAARDVPQPYVWPTDSAAHNCRTSSYHVHHSRKVGGRTMQRKLGSRTSKADSAAQRARLNGLLRVGDRAGRVFEVVA